jgi:rhodanese-related sulfurtransferase
MHSGDLFIYFFYIFCLNPVPIHMPPILQAYVKDSIWIPMYEVDKSLDPGTLFKKLSNFTMGGWWSGLPLMKYNERFMPDVVAKIPKSYNLVVGCQKGLRSLAACEQLYKAGYRNLFWLNGGFDAAQEGVLISVVCLPVIPFCHKVDSILDTVLSGFFIPPDLGCFTIAMDCQFLWISKQNVHATN